MTWRRFCLWILPLAAGHQRPELAIDDLQLSSIGSFVTAASCSCGPPEDASDDALINLKEWNCRRITEAGENYTRLAQLYGQKVNSLWEVRLKSARLMCEQATNSSDLTQRAALACCAWGDVLMQHRECCNVAGPPYCVNPPKSKMGHALPLIIVLVVAFMVPALAKCCRCEGCCRNCCRNSFFAPRLMHVESVEDGAPETGHAVPRNNDAVTLQQKLENIWDKRSLKTLENADLWKNLSVKCFVDMQVAFDFQLDSVQNQYEHFLSLWRSHVSVYCDRKQNEIRVWDERHLLPNALAELRNDLLQSFRVWRKQFRAARKDPVKRYEWCSNPEGGRYLEEVAMFLLVWGEAANLRFMPEVLYFITHIMLETEEPAEHFQRGDKAAIVRNADAGPTGSSHAFLVDIVRPIYKVVFDEHYQAPFKMKDGFDRYLPPDAANYDDWNELFQDFDRLIAKIDAVQPIDIDVATLPLPAELRERRTPADHVELTYQWLRRIPWGNFLKNVKTHRELHSWWGVWAGTHRIWFLHALLFFLTMWLVSSSSLESASESKGGWSVLLGGNSPMVCLSFIGLLVPIHLLLCVASSLFTTGVALWKPCRARKVLLYICQVLFAMVVVATFIWVRWLDAHDSPDLDIALALHFLVSCLGVFYILEQPFQNGDKLRYPTGATCDIDLLRNKLIRWMFWLGVLAFKFWFGKGSIQAIYAATRDLPISRPGKETLEEIPTFAFGPNWDKDMMEWVALWGTGFMCYVADTQYWFVLGCGLLGCILALLQRGSDLGGSLWAFVCEDAIWAIRNRFKEKVISVAHEVPGPLHGLSTDGPDMWFRLVWDRIIDFMVCEDKLKSGDAGKFKYNNRRAADCSSDLCSKPLTHYLRDLDGGVQGWTTKTWKMSQASCFQRCFDPSFDGCRDDHWPRNQEVQWRLNAFARNLSSSDMPRPFLTPFIPGITVLIPTYEEPVLHTWDELTRRDPGEEVKYIRFLEARYRYDFDAFGERMQRSDVDFPLRVVQWDDFRRRHQKDEVIMWAALRSQTIWRTVEGLMLYLPALNCFHEMVKGRENFPGNRLTWDVHEVFTCTVAMQTYSSAKFKKHNYQHAHELLDAFRRKLTQAERDQGKTQVEPGDPQSFQIAFIREEAVRKNKDKIQQLKEKLAEMKAAGDAAELRQEMESLEKEAAQATKEDDLREKTAQADGIQQKNRYFSCLLDGSCDLDEKPKKLRLSALKEDATKEEEQKWAAEKAKYEARLVEVEEWSEKASVEQRPRLKVELPGAPILSNGKPDNQNTAIHFTRGSIIQCIDCNQGGYFEQMLLLPCALGEFRQSNPQHTGLNPRIVGFAEHITSDIGSLGDFAAGAETAFGTMLQRCYAFLGGRMHYGHPDMMNKEFMIQQGGISKGTKILNLSEDIFAGIDFTLRGSGRNIVHREYLHVAKGRDLGFNSILTFFAKLSSGTAEQAITRQMFRLGHELDLPEFLTFYYAHVGFYLTQFFLSKSIPLLVFIWLVVVLDDPEKNFPALNPDADKTSGAAAIAKLLSTQFSYLLLVFIVAQMAPLFLQVWLETSFGVALKRMVKQVFTGAPLHFVFQAKVIGVFITNEVTLGGAKYMATGRGLPTTRRATIQAGKVEVKVVDGKEVKEFKGQSLYTDYATAALYDGAQLLLGTVLVILGGGLDIGSSARWSLFWWLFALGMTICSWLLAPFIFNPYQFKCQHMCTDWWNWWDFFFANKGQNWKNWYEIERLQRDAGLRSSFVEIIKKAIFLGAWYTIFNQKVHMLTVIFSRASFRVLAKVFMPPVILSTLLCCALPLFKRCPVPLGVSALLVLGFDSLETLYYLWNLMLVDWWKSFTVGLILKFSLLSLCLELYECAFRIRCDPPPDPPAGEAAPPDPPAGEAAERTWSERTYETLRIGWVTWLHAHRMAQDLFVSFLILFLLTLGSLILGWNRCHNCLIYRDWGTVEREGENERPAQQHERPPAAQQNERPPAAQRNERPPAAPQQNERPPAAQDAALEMMPQREIQQENERPPAAQQENERPPAAQDAALEMMPQGEVQR